MEEPAEVVTLWRPASQAERDSVEASSWRAWPAAGEPSFRATVDRRHATEAARMRLVPRDGVGYVMSFEVRREFLDRHDVDEVLPGSG
jgi:hypothetical protein